MTKCEAIYNELKDVLEEPEKLCKGIIRRIAKIDTCKYTFFIDSNNGKILKIEIFDYPQLFELWNK